MAISWFSWLAALLLQPGYDVPPERPPATAAAEDRAGNRLEAFPVSIAAPAEGSDEAELRAARHCVAERDWCVWADRAAAGEAWQLSVFHNPDTRRPHSPIPRTLALEGGDSPDVVYAVWPWLVREAGGTMLVGLLATRRAGFSGGGALATRLLLYRADPDDRALRPVLEAPVEGSAMVRACFSEEDMRRRREACHDEYALVGALRLDPATAAGPPRFLLETRARTYPGDLSRWEDSADRPPLRARDLVWAADPACSFRRVYAFDPAAGRYAPDSALPPCDQYLVADL